METKKLYRSRNNKIVAGVAGGLGEYLNVDPIIFRILFFFLAFMGGAGAVIYLILLIIMPQEPFVFNASSGRQNGGFQEAAAENDANPTMENGNDPLEDEINNVGNAFQGQDRNKIVGLTIGIILIVFGMYVLFSKLWHIDWARFVFPMILIVSGVIIMLSSINRKNKNHA
ncbi:PspC domain-containing protein [Bacteroidales bacterium OttesenSCG-928-B11]|nr:PspC domain-containing protein [Bacteroidales bacterium OttesenSCG-928-B11]MDL2326186.1 PspC domain-containing protein [Bacteroidales bacterium OttesenSCG-928-A14]